MVILNLLPQSSTTNLPSQNILKSGKIHANFKAINNITRFIAGLVIMLSLNATPAFAKESLSFGVVPQQSARKLAKTWGPLLDWAGKASGLIIRFKTAPDIPSFERRLAAGAYDFAYMNPYHFTLFNQQPGYQALVRARDKRIKGILVVRNDALYHTIQDLAGQTLAFPSPTAFAASILVKSTLSKQQTPIKPKYVTSHDSVYRSVAQGIYPAGGGVIRTFKALAPDIRKKLRILMQTEEYTPHAVAYHPRIEQNTAMALRQALIELRQSRQGRSLLEPLKIKGWEAAKNEDWNDVRDLHIKPLDTHIQDNPQHE
ncbi:phosphate/phosphite/phosphonate ABC transporter substrate-binding protein [Magnetococcales bacterium HHB-1]